MNDLKSPSSAKRQKTITFALDKQKTQDGQIARSRLSTQYQANFRLPNELIFALDKKKTQDGQIARSRLSTQYQAKRNRSYIKKKGL